MRNWLLVLVGSAGLLWSTARKAVAQCEKCDSKLAYVADFCYTDPQYEGLCAQFSEKQPNFLLQNGKKARYIPATSDANFGYFISLANTRKLKIKAIEMLFLQQALKAWEVESRKFGYTYRESGLGIKILNEGEGPLPEKGKPVVVHYSGYLEDGTKFDSSYDRNKPFTFTLGIGQVIKGWDEGIGMLKPGSKALLRIPPDLGYGSTARGQIPANATLYFEVEVLK